MIRGAVCFYIASLELDPDTYRDGMALAPF